MQEPIVDRTGEEALSNRVPPAGTSPNRCLLRVDSSEHHAALLALARRCDAFDVRVERLVVGDSFIGDAILVESSVYTIGIYREKWRMTSTAKLFKNGRSQAVRLPREFRFDGDRVRVRRAGRGVLVEPMFTDVSAWFAELDRLAIEPFMPDGRQQPSTPRRDVFDDDLSA